MTFPPGPVLVVLGLLVAIPSPPGRGRLAKGFLDGVFVALIGLWLVATLDPATRMVVPFWGGELVLVEASPLRMVFAWAFALAFLLWSLYAWTLDDAVERGAGTIYAGCALGVVFAGDLLTLFLFWEGMALASTVVVLRGGTEASSRAGFRYLMVHLLGGVLLLVGIGFWHARTGSLAFGPIPLEGVGPWLVFAGFAVNAAAWPMAAWLPDAYPQASPTGTVLLGTFTTKTAVYVLVAAFAGETALLVFGAGMAVYAVVYALGTRDVRRLLAYSLVGQVGFMLCAAGAGGALGQAAAAAHAFMHVLYKSLLFMSAGVVFGATGSAVGGRFAGLGRALPFAALFGLVGAAAISALPGTNGYVSKTLVFDSLDARGGAIPTLVGWILLAASAAAPLYVGLRFPWLAFSGSGPPPPRITPPPRSARWAMGLTALLCVGLGLWPKPLLDLLPGRPAPHLWTAAHLGKQLLLLAIGTVLFLAWRRVARRVGHPVRDPLPDTDALYVPAVRRTVAFVRGPFLRALTALSALLNVRLPRVLGTFAGNPAGTTRLGYERLRLAAAGLLGSDAAIDAAQERYHVQLERCRRLPGGAWPIGRTVFYVTLLLAVYAVIWLFA